MREWTVTIKLFHQFVRYEPNKKNKKSKRSAPTTNTTHATMSTSSVLPLRPPIDHTPDARTRIALDEDPAPVLEALGCETARAVVTALGDEPATASDVAEAVGTSLQNAQYHLERLIDANLVARVGTWHSSKGNEMTVYGLANERVELSLT